jgi:hypothetical protein
MQAAETQAEIKQAFATGVIRAAWAHDVAVIPAKLVLRESGGAGIQPVDIAFSMARGVDSRFRGNDCAWPGIPSEITPLACFLAKAV